MFNQGSHAFYPVAIIHVDDSIDGFYFCVMYVTADNSIKATLATVISKIKLKLKNKIHRWFDLVFEIPTETPIAKAKTVTNPIEATVKAKNKIIQFVSQEVCLLYTSPSPRD